MMSRLQTEIARVAGVEQLDTRTVLKHPMQRCEFEAVVNMVKRDLRTRIADGLVERVPIELVKLPAAWRETEFRLRVYAMSEETLARLIDTAYDYGARGLRMVNLPSTSEPITSESWNNACAGLGTKG